MSCSLEFPESGVKVDFCIQGSKQKILIDVLIKHGDMNVNNLATALDVPIQTLHDIYQGKRTLDGEKADNLAQLFLMFLGKHFFRKCTLIRHL